MSVTMLLNCSVHATVARLGATAVFVRVCHLRNAPHHADLLAERETRIAQIRAEYQVEALKDDPILAGYRRLHDAVGRSNKKNVASTEALLKLVLETGRFPQINVLVDLYNLLAARTHLSIGAHDCAQVVGGIHLRLTSGAETFRPLGSDEAKPVQAGEYAYIDEADTVLCRLEVRQCDQTKITVDTTDAIVILQGNPNVPVELLRSATETLCARIAQYCGGESTVLCAPWQ